MMQMSKFKFSGKSIIGVAVLAFCSTLALGSLMMPDKAHAEPNKGSEMMELASLAADKSAVAEKLPLPADIDHGPNPDNIIDSNSEELKKFLQEGRKTPWIESSMVDRQMLMAFDTADELLKEVQAGLEVNIQEGLVAYKSMQRLPFNQVLIPDHLTGDLQSLVKPQVYFNMKNSTYHVFETVGERLLAYELDNCVRFYQELTLDCTAA